MLSGRLFVRSVMPVLVTLPYGSTGTCFQMPRVRKLRPDPHRQRYRNDLGPEYKWIPRGTYSY
jgi:hypothetical protein